MQDDSASLTKSLTVRLTPDELKRFEELQAWLQSKSPLKGVRVSQRAVFLEMMERLEQRRIDLERSNR